MQSKGSGKMTPKQIINKALSTVIHGRYTPYDKSTVWRSYHRITENIACMVIHEEDGFGYIAHMIFAEEKDGECTLINAPMYTSFNRDKVRDKVRDIRKQYRQGIEYLRGEVYGV